MVRTSEEVKQVAAALCRAQKNFGAAAKSSENPAYRSKYADLSSVIAAVLHHLNAEGISVTQHPQLSIDGSGELHSNLLTVTTRLQHESGEFMESDLSLPAVQRERFDAQSVGSAITYACRYALQSICVVPREDDDGNAASGVGSREDAQAVAKRKTRELKEKIAERKGHGTPEVGIPVSSTLFCVFDKSTELYEVTGEKELKNKNRDILRPLWKAEAQTILATPEQIEILKLALEERGVMLKELQPNEARV